ELIQRMLFALDGAILQDRLSHGCVPQCSPRPGPAAPTHKIDSQSVTGEAWGSFYEGESFERIHAQGTRSLSMDRPDSEMNRGLKHGGPWGSLPRQIKGEREAHAPFPFDF